MSRRRRGFVGLLALAMLGACAPKLPPGVAPRRLNDAISAEIGDPNTCVLVAAAGSGDVAFRYNSHTMCARALPTCAGAARGSVDALVKLVAKDGRPRAVSCPSSPDGDRTVAWAAGPIAGRGLVYAAVMEGDRALPSRVVAERLARAFRTAGL